MNCWWIIILLLLCNNNGGSYNSRNNHCGCGNAYKQTKNTCGCNAVNTERSCGSSYTGCVSTGSYIPNCGSHKSHDCEC